MCLNKGARPTVAEFCDRVHQRNLDHLTVWHNVGVDVEHGIWAIAGARQGTYNTMLVSDWDYREVQSFEFLNNYWESTVSRLDPTSLVEHYQQELSTQLDLPMNLLDAKQSQFFKHHYRSNWHNRGVMTREIDVIRQQEGW
jgi:hypothetical protein